ncbi:MAG: GntR family transcriptional regulator [Desulfosarcina sp.]
MNLKIHEIIKDRILFLEYQPGHILNEKVLAEEFKMSRTPLREVLMRLEWDKLVRILPRTGALVTEIEFHLMMNTYQVRFEIEGMVGRLAAENCKDGDLKKIDAILEKCSPLYEDRDCRKLAGIDLEFRNLLLKAANNPVLEETSITLYTITQRLWYTIMDRGDWHDEVRNVQDEISGTKKSWEDGNPERAGRFRKDALMRHFESIRGKFLGNSVN